MVSLIFSIAYAVVKLIYAPAADTGTGQPLKSDYSLMLLQCCLGLVVMSLPSFLEKRFSLKLPSRMYILYFAFLYCAIYLGEVRNFYYVVPHWDSILHGFSSGMLGFLGFILVRFFNDSKTVNVHLSPLFIAIFAFCFALAIGTVWEIYEFAVDLILGLNMQKYRLPDGTLKIGQTALFDTMKDLVIDAAGALVISALGYFDIKRKRAKKKAIPSE